MSRESQTVLLGHQHRALGSTGLVLRCAAARLRLAAPPKEQGAVRSERVYTGLTAPAGAHRPPEKQKTDSVGVSGRGDRPQTHPCHGSSIGEPPRPGLSPHGT